MSCVDDLDDRNRMRIRLAELENENPRVWYERRVAVGFYCGYSKAQRRAERRLDMPDTLKEGHAQMVRLGFYGERERPEVCP